MRNFGKGRLRKIAKTLAQKFGVEDEITHRVETMTNSSTLVNELIIPEADILPEMDSPHERLRKARIAAGYETAADAARALGMPTATYHGHENGTTKFTRKVAAYAKKFNVTMDYLVTGRGLKAYNTRTPVVAYIGAGAEVFPLDDHAKGRGLELVDPPSGLSGDFVAARIKGSSMHPLKEGWLVFWSRDQEGVPEDCLGQLCVVQEAGGAMWLKDLRKGTGKGLYTLESWNGPSREDVHLDWASRVLDIRPKR